MKSIRRSFAAGVIAAAAFPTIAAAEVKRPDLEALAREIDEARLTLDVPGMAVAIVESGDVVLARGFGERTLGQSDSVDEHTLFAIGSASKAFTAASVAMLIDDGEVRWSDRVIEHLPWLRLHDPYPTDELRVVDILSHRSGLPRGDMLWYGSGLGRREIVEQLPELEPNTSFRSQFGYQNIMYLTAGLIIEELTDATWDDWVASRIFGPLGMDDSNTSVTELSSVENVATPHAKIDGEILTVPYRNIDNVAPAGSINSNVVDMARWIELLLNEGRLAEGDDTEQIVSEGSLDVMWTPVTTATLPGPSSALRAKSHFLLYGLGWFIQDYRGERLIHHGGNIDGMSALVAMLPEHDLGVVVLTNLNGSAAPMAVANEIFDAYLGHDDHDWPAAAREFTNTIEKTQDQAKAQAEAERIEGTSPSLPLADYAGEYGHDYYGKLTITLEDDALVLTRGELVGDLSHWHYDTFEATNRDPMPEFGNVTFILGGDGKVAELVALGIDEWERAPEKPKADESIDLTEEAMRRYTGRFIQESIGLQVTVFIKDGGLRAQIPGQPSFEMLPTGEHEFALGGLPGDISVEIVYTFNEDGSVEAFSFTQTPGGSFDLKPASD